jgi:flagellar protein FliS
MSENLLSTIEPVRPVVGRSASALASSVVPSLYSRLARSLQLADDAFAAGDVIKRGRELELSSSLVFELLATLNFRDGGELTPRLAALYSYFASEILNIGRTNNRATLSALIDMVGVLGRKWQDDSTDEGAVESQDFVSSPERQFALW